LYETEVEEFKLTTCSVRLEHYWLVNWPLTCS